MDLNKYFHGKVMIKKPWENITIGMVNSVFLEELESFLLDNNIEVKEQGETKYNFEDIKGLLEDKNSWEYETQEIVKVKFKWHLIKGNRKIGNLSGTTQFFKESDFDSLQNIWIEIFN